MEKFEEIQKKALELFEQKKYLLRVHSLGRMTERSIYPFEII